MLNGSRAILTMSPSSGSFFMSGFRLQLNRLSVNRPEKDPQERRVDAAEKID